MIKIAILQKKNSNWNMLKTPSKMHMYKMVKIDKTVFQIVGGGGVLLKPPPRIVSYLKYPGSVRVKIQVKILELQCFYTTINSLCSFNQILCPNKV